MDGEKFSVGEAIKFGWETVIGNIKLFLIAALIVLGINIMSWVSDSWVVQIVAAALCMVVSLGLMRICLRFVDGDSGELVDLFGTFSLIISYFIASIVLGIIAGIGFLLCIIPGIILSVRFQFFGWAIVDKELGPFEAMQESWELTRGSFWNLVLIALALLGINILGAIPLGLGLFITGPLSMVAMGFVYRRLEESAAG